MEYIQDIESFTSKNRTDFHQLGCFIVVVSLICNILKSHRAEKVVPLCDIEQQLEKKIVTGYIDDPLVCDDSKKCVDFLTELCELVFSRYC